MKAFVFGTVGLGGRQGGALPHKPGNRLSTLCGRWFHPNDLALCLAMSIPLSYFLSLRSGRVMTWFYRIQIMLASGTILLTASRAGLLSGVVAIGVVPIVQWHVAQPRRFTNLVLTTALVVVAVLFAPQSSLSRLSTISAEVSGGSRTTIWTAGLELFPMHPLLGIGGWGLPGTRRAGPRSP
jgi:O-antigen ligase